MQFIQNLGNSSDLTISVWLRMNDLANWRALVIKNSYSLGYGMMIPATGDVRIYSSGLSPSGTTDIDTSFVPDTWYHFAFTYNHTGIAGYKNGAFISSAGRTGNITSTTNPLYIGQSSVGSYFFNGTIDEVMIFNRSLSTAEIQSIYNYQD